MSYLEFIFHAGDGLSGLQGRQLLDVAVEVPCVDLRGPAGHRLVQGLVDEDVLLLGLHHVITLGAQAGHVTVDVDRLLVLDALQHGVDDDVGPGPPDTGTVLIIINNNNNNIYKVQHIHF